MPAEDFSLASVGTEASLKAFIMEPRHKERDIQAWEDNMGVERRTAAH